MRYDYDKDPELERIRKQIGIGTIMSRSSKEKLKTFLVVAGVILVVGGGVFSFAWMALDSGYGACLIVRCVKIIP